MAGTKTNTQPTENGPNTSDKVCLDDVEKGNKLGLEDLSTDEESGDDGYDINEGETQPKESCCSDQLKKMKSTADYWSLWIGLASFSLGETILCF